MAWLNSSTQLGGFVGSEAREFTGEMVTGWCVTVGLLVDIGAACHVAVHWRGAGKPGLTGRRIRHPREATADDTGTLQAVPLTFPDPLQGYASNWRQDHHLWGKQYRQALRPLALAVP